LLVTLMRGPQERLDFIRRHAFGNIVGIMPYREIAMGDSDPTGRSQTADAWGQSTQEDKNDPAFPLFGGPTADYPPTQKEAEER
jgi:hypothetical protein